jgi:hypothetical protein
MHTNNQQLDRDDKLDIANRDDAGNVSLVACPECGNVASIEWSSWVGESLHLKFRCIERHWFLMLAERVTYYGSGVAYQPIQNV